VCNKRLETVSYATRSSTLQVTVVRTTSMYRLPDSLKDETTVYLSDLKIQFVPRSKHSASVIKTSQLM